MPPLDETDIKQLAARAHAPNPFDQPALIMLSLPPNVQRKFVFAILDEAHLVHGEPKSLVKTACSIMRCALRLYHPDNDLLAIDRVLLWCFEWIRERAC